MCAAVWKTDSHCHTTDFTLVILKVNCKIDDIFKGMQHCQIMYVCTVHKNRHNMTK